MVDVLGRQGDDGMDRRILVGRYRGHVALRAPMLADDPADVTFREDARGASTITVVRRWRA